MKLNNRGFTLVELMIVVAIIGILASIAIPNFQKYQARARQREANIALSGVYTALRSFSAEKNTFTGCIRQAGYAPENSNGNTQASSAQRYYFVGIDIHLLPSTCGPVGNQSCVTFAWDGVGNYEVPGGACTWVSGLTIGAAITSGDNEFANTAKAFTGVTITEANALSANSTVSQNNFTAAAGGSISSASAVIDIWSINEGKYLRNVTNGAN